MTEKQTGKAEEGNASNRGRWDEPRLTAVGTVGDVLQDTGKGKLRIVGGDSGESRKPTGIE
jgi:hypothetical protein